MAEKLDTVEFAVHQLEQSLLTIGLFGGKATLQHLADLHNRILNGWLGDRETASSLAKAVEAVMAPSLAKAVEAVMETIDVDDNGKRLNNCIWTDAEKISGESEKIFSSP